MGRRTEEGRERGRNITETVGSLYARERGRQAEKQAKATVQAPQPVPEKKDDDMEEDEEEPEVGEEVAGTRDTPIEVVAEVLAPREVPKPVEVKQKPRVEEVPTRTLPTMRDEVATAIWQWAGGPPKDKRRVVVDEGSVGVSRL